VSNKDDEKILGIIILIGLALIILVAVLQALTIIFMILTIISIIVMGFFDEWNRQDYFMYALISFALIIVFFAAGRATYTASEALLENKLTNGLMQFTAFFFQIQNERLRLINEVETAQINILKNVTDAIPP
jgi:UDP-N-acetylmuramyl pentapeptide phosphotransferase/UDP-N-acetylglucosamine-1-phosphate transferase